MSLLPAEFIEREARAGFPGFPGMRLAGSIPVSQGLLNDLLSQAEQVPKGLRIEIENGNRVIARLGVMQAAATLQSPTALDGRTITLELASSMVAWTISQYVRMPFISIAGRILTIDLASVPALAPWRASLAHLERMTFSTQPGVLTVAIDWKVPTGAKDGTRAE